MSGPRRIRVLHVFRSMDRGGAETWIVNVLRNIDRERFQFDFLLESNRPGAYDAEIQALGGKLYYAGGPKRLPQFAAAFRRIVRQGGPYDVIHSHVHHSSGLMLALAAREGIPVRIAHSHSDIRPLQERAAAMRKVYYRVTEALIRRYATVGLAASRDAAVSLFGEQWELDSRFRVMHCGIDLAPYERSVDREAVRERFGIPADAFVIGHVGRFVPVKNHAFLVDVFAHIHAQRPNARLLLVGDGPLRAEIERKVLGLGLQGSVVFAGLQEDIAEILIGAMDCFVFPSMYEGLGLAVVEAQAAGLPCFVSNTIPPEGLMVNRLISRLSLELEPGTWSAHIAMRGGAENEARRREAYGQIRDSSFNILAGMDALRRIYAA